MKALREWKFQDEIYFSHIHLFYGDYATFCAKVKAKYGCEPPVSEPGGLAWAAEWQGKGYQPTQYVIWLPATNKLRTPTELSDLVHECLHVTCYVMFERGFEPKADDNEAFTYYQGWLFEQSLTRLRCSK